MPFGALSATQQILIKIQLMGGPKYRSEMVKNKVVTQQQALAYGRLATAAELATKRTFMHNQAVFMARRGLFYATLGTVGLATATAALGFSYLNTMQQTEVALKDVMGGTAALQGEMNELFKMAAFTPFSFQQITEAFRIMYAGFQPLGIETEKINKTLSSTIDILSFTGQLTPTSLKRTSNALQDMANMGKLTGVTLNQLGRLGIPLGLILRKELGLTGDQIERVRDLGIDSTRVLDAIISYAGKTPGIMGAAAAQASGTLFGAWSTFKDLLSQAAGESERGIFGFIHKTLQGVNDELNALSQPGEPIQMNQIIAALDRQLSPKTHLIANLFTAATAAGKTLIVILEGMAKAFQMVMAPINAVLNLFGIGNGAAKLLGVTVGILTGLLLVAAPAWIGYKVASELATAALWYNSQAIRINTGLMKAQLFLLGGGGKTGLIGRWAAWANAMTTVPVAADVAEKAFDLGGEDAVNDLTKPIKANQGIFARFSRRIIDIGSAIGALALTFKKEGLKTGIKAVGLQMAALIGPIYASAAASYVAAGGFTGMAVAVWAAIGPFVLIGGAILAVALGLVVLYRKWDWFHYKVNAGIEFIKKYWEWLLFGIPVFGQVIFVVVKIVEHFEFFRDIIIDVVNWIKRMIDWINRIPSPKDVPGLGWILKHPGPSGIDAVRKASDAGKWLLREDIEKRQHGGSIFRTGPVLVGEQGPELVNLPRGANVIPNSRLEVGSIFGRGGINLPTGDNSDRPIVVQVMLDRKVLAEGVARANQDYAARR